MQGLWCLFLVFHQKTVSKYQIEAWVYFLPLLSAGAHFTLVLLYCSLQLSCHLALWHHKVSLLPSLSFSNGNMLDGRQSIYKLSTRVPYPASSILLFGAPRLLRASVVIWNTFPSLYFFSEAYVQGSWQVVWYSLSILATTNYLLPIRHFIWAHCIREPNTNLQLKLAHGHNM